MDAYCECGPWGASIHATLGGVHTWTCYTHALENIMDISLKIINTDLIVVLDEMSVDHQSHWALSSGDHEYLCKIQVVVETFCCSSKWWADTASFMQIVWLKSDTLTNAQCIILKCCSGVSQFIPSVFINNHIYDFQMCVHHV